MSADISDLPELVDVATESAEQKPEAAKKVGDEDEFRPVVSKRKRRQEKMELEKSASQTQDDEDNEAELDMEEIEEILGEKPEDDQPLKKIRFPPVSAEKLTVTRTKHYSSNSKVQFLCFLGGLCRVQENPCPSEQIQSTQR